MPLPAFDLNRDGIVELSAAVISKLPSHHVFRYIHTLTADTALLSFFIRHLQPILDGQDVIDIRLTESQQKQLSRVQPIVIEAVRKTMIPFAVVETDTYLRALSLCDPVFDDYAYSTAYAEDRSEFHPQVKIEITQFLRLLSRAWELYPDELNAFKPYLKDTTIFPVSESDELDTASDISTDIEDEVDNYATNALILAFATLAKLLPWRDQFINYIQSPNKDAEIVENLDNICREFLDQAALTLKAQTLIGMSLTQTLEAEELHSFCQAFLNLTKASADSDFDKRQWLCYTKLYQHGEEKGFYQKSCHLHAMIELANTQADRGCFQRIESILTQDKLPRLGEIKDTIGQTMVSALTDSLENSFNSSTTTTSATTYTSTDSDSDHASPSRSRTGSTSP